MKENDDARILLATTFMGNNPPHPYTYHPYWTEGITRGKDYRYHADLGKFFPSAPAISVCYLWGQYETETPVTLQATLIPESPVQVFVNGDQVGETTVQAERFSSPVTVMLPMKKGKNDIVLAIEHTAHGFGCAFGTWVGKLDYWFSLPLKWKEEGLAVSHPVEKKLTEISPASLRTLEWLLPPASDEDTKEVFSRLYPDAKEGNVAMATTTLTVGRETTLKSESDAILLLDGKKVTSPATLRVGCHSLSIIATKGKGSWGFNLHGHYKASNPMLEEGSPFDFCYAGPFETVRQAETRTAEPMKPFMTEEGLSYWKLDRKGSWVRMYNENPLFGHWSYPLGVTLYGLCLTERSMRVSDPRFAKRIHDYLNAYLALTISTYPYALWDKQKFGGATAVHHLMTSLDSLDDCGSFCSTLLEIAKDHEIPPYDALVKAAARHILHGQARLSDGTFFRKKQMHSFHNGTMWADDLYMSVPFLTRYASYAHDKKALEDAGRQFIGFKKRLYMPEEQIFSHVYDFNRGFQTGIPWGRGNGWVLFSMSELLTVLPKKDPSYRKVLELFQSMAEGVSKLQDEQGSWHQVLTMGDSYSEASCTAMFTASFVRGLRNGWITGDIYKSEALKGAAALRRKFIDSEGHLHGVCRGSEFSLSPYYYAERLLPRLDDPHGIGIVLIALNEADNL